MGQESAGVNRKLCNRVLTARLLLYVCAGRHHGGRHDDGGALHGRAAAAGGAPPERGAAPPRAHGGVRAGQRARPGGPGLYPIGQASQSTHHLFFFGL